MPFPVSLATVTVSFTFLNVNGDPETGTVAFARSQYLRSTSDDTIITPGTRTATLNGTGQGSITLPVTDDAQWTPQGWTYRVTETLGGGTRTYDILLPEASGNQNLADIAPEISPEDGVTYILRSEMGAANGVATLGSDGKVPSAQLPAAGGSIASSIVDAKGDLLTATANDTPARLPVGTNGFVLKANSAMATGLEWAAEASSSGIAATIFDAKGDILVATAADTPARKAVGANGTFLKANSGQSDGLEWAVIAIANVDSLQAALDLKIDETIVNAKGDLIVATADDTPARFAVGSNGQFLRADSAQASGLIWDSLDAADLPAHNHDAGDITTGTLDLQRGGTGLSTVTAGSFLQGAGTSALVVRSPAQVLSDIGAAAAAHTHNIKKTFMFDFSGNLAAGSGSARLYNREGVTLTILGIWLHVVTAPASQSILVDAHKVGTTIYTTQANRPSIAAGANVGTLAAPDVTSWADGDYLTIDIDQVGTGTTGADLTGGIVVQYAG